MKFTDEQIDVAIQVESIILEKRMHVREAAAFIKKMWEGGDYEYFDSFEDYLEAIHDAEFSLLYAD